MTWPRFIVGWAVVVLLVLWWFSRTDEDDDDGYDWDAAWLRVLEEKPFPQWGLEWPLPDNEGEAL